jgi:hypothetical protein
LGAAVGVYGGGPELALWGDVAGCGGGEGIGWLSVVGVGVRGRAEEEVSGLLGEGARDCAEGVLDGVCGDGGSG